MRTLRISLASLFFSLSLAACDEQAFETERDAELDEALDEEESEDEPFEGIHEIDPPDVEHADVPLFPTELGPDQLDADQDTIPCDPPLPGLDRAAPELGDEDEPTPAKPYDYDASEIPDEDEDCEDDEDCEAEAED